MPPSRPWTCSVPPWRAAAFAAGALGAAALGAAAFGAAALGAAALGAAALRLGGLGLGSLGSRSLRLGRGRYLRGLPLRTLGGLRRHLGFALLACLLAGLRLLAKRAEDERHVAPLLDGRVLDDRQVGDVLREALQQATARVGARLLAAAEHDGDLDLVARLEEADDVALLGLVVVGVDLETETDLLDDGVGLVATRLARLHRGLVLELAVVHELRYGGTRLGRDLDQVEIRLLGKPQRVLDPHDADLFALGADQADLGHADFFVDARLVDVRSFHGRRPAKEKAPARTQAEATQPWRTRTRPPGPKPWPRSGPRVGGELHLRATGKPAAGR